MGDMQFNGTPEEWDALVRKNREITVKLYTEEKSEIPIKLYTKEMFLIAAEKCEVSMIDAKHIMKYIDEYVTPIELPSDEEIEKASFTEKYQVAFNPFASGAKWMRYKILNK